MKNAIIVFLVITVVCSLGGCIFLLYQMMQQRQSYEQKIAGLNSEIVLQRTSKDKIRDIWEEQTAKQDKLEVTQQNLNTQISNYLLRLN
jgi:hypothetical protein